MIPACRFPFICGIIFALNQSNLTGIGLKEFKFKVGKDLFPTLPMRKVVSVVNEQQMKAQCSDRLTSFSELGIKFLLLKVSCSRTVTQHVITLKFIPEISTSAIIKLVKIID